MPPEHAWLPEYSATKNRFLPPSPHSPPTPSPDHRPDCSTYFPRIPEASLQAPRPVPGTLRKGRPALRYRAACPDSRPCARTGEGRDTHFPLQREHPPRAEAIPEAETAYSYINEPLLQRLPVHLPALPYLRRISEKAAAASLSERFPEGSPSRLFSLPAPAGAYSP